MKDAGDTMKPSPHRPLVLIFMGVSGSGKTTVGTLFAKKTGALFFEGDEFHPPENIEKMRHGVPLTDADRVNWLRTLREIIVRSLDRGAGTVMACSALKAAYRDLLQGGDARVKFVYLTGPRSVIEARLKTRRNHFMPPTLLDSQLATLEPPADALTFSCEKPPEEIVTALIQTLGTAGVD
ncbi:MAG TPA: gluconokinase, GntK/IdnK-type [Verrucomicrobiae bacterium]|nr:gluconokinase, GntK/IdnK-type [Verrucomicrobiae bacterium]